MESVQGAFARYTYTRTFLAYFHAYFHCSFRLISKRNSRSMVDTLGSYLATFFTTFRCLGRNRNLRNFLHSPPPPYTPCTTTSSRQHQPYTLRQTRTYSIGHAHANRHRDSPINIAFTLYNSLPIDITTHPRRNSFRNNASSLLLSSTCSCSAHLLVSDNIIISNVYLTISITRANVIAPFVFMIHCFLPPRLKGKLRQKSKFHQL